MKKRNKKHVQRLEVIMKSFRILYTTVLFIMLIICLGANVLIQNTGKNKVSRPYRVEAERIADVIRQKGMDAIDLNEYTYIKNIEKLTPDSQASFYEAEEDYLLKTIGRDIYRMDYLYIDTGNKDMVVMNLVFILFGGMILFLLFIIWRNILKPFDTIRDVPYELAKGNLVVPLKENKEKYFGRFLWGLDLLREKLESQRQKELELQREKKTLILSLSHDIKTPLSIIELSAKALQKGLYTEEKKKQEVADSIHKKCIEINDYLNKIIQASNEDLLHFEVQDSEFYLSHLIKEITHFYKDKLELLKTDFVIEAYHDRLLKGDSDRAAEVLQNLMENAIKYGDGKKIALQISNEEDCILIGVANSGCSLNPEEISHIFDSFYRGSNVGSNSGSGLGLYICKELMRRMDGEIFAEQKGGQMIVTAVFRII